MNMTPKVPSPRLTTLWRMRSGLVFAVALRTDRNQQSADSFWSMSFLCGPLAPKSGRVEKLEVAPASVGSAMLSPLRVRSAPLAKERTRRTLRAFSQAVASLMESLMLPHQMASSSAHNEAFPLPPQGQMGVD